MFWVSYNNISWQEMFYLLDNKLYPEYSLYLLVYCICGLIVYVFLKDDDYFIYKINWGMLKMLIGKNQR